MDFTAASRRAKRQEAQLALARVGLPMDGLPPSTRQSQHSSAAGAASLITGATAAYLLWVENIAKAPATIRMHRSALQTFTHWLVQRGEDCGCAGVTHELVDNYVAYLRHEYRTPLDRPLSDRSIRQYSLVLKIFAAWGAKGKRYWPASPIGEYDLPEFTETEIEPYSHDELRSLLEERSGVKRFRWHLLRHTCGTESLKNGADSLDVQETLGHSTSAMTRRYQHLTDDDRRQRQARYSPVQALLGKSAPRENRFRRKEH